MTISVIFPSNPTLYQSYSTGSATWVWNGINWTLGQPSLASVATSGNYTDLINRPDLTQYATTAKLSQYATLANLNSYALASNLATYATVDNFNTLKTSTVTINGTSIVLGASGTVAASAGTLTGNTLNSTVVNSSLTSVGTLTTLRVSGNAYIGNINIKSLAIAMGAALA
jgi:hypothetical protein